MHSVKTSVVLKYNWHLQRVLGLYPTSHLKCTYYFFSFVVNIMFTTLYPTTLVIQLFFTENLKQFIEALSLTTTNVVNSCKQFNTFIYRKDMLAMDEFLNELDTRTEGIEQINYLQRIIRKSLRFFKVIFWLFVSTGLLSEIATIFASSRRLMYPAWFPFDWKTSDLYYAIAHIYQFIGIMFGVMQEITNDTFPALSMGILTAHIQTLMMRIRAIGTDPLKSREENYNKLVGCIRDYQLLIQYYVALQRVTSYGLLLQFFATVAVTCITGAYVLFANGTVFDMIYLSSYLFCIFLEILMSCYYANELMYESRIITEAIYTCNWFEQNRKFKKVLIIFLQISQKDMTLTAGDLIVVNLASFMSVIKTSYSFFAVLVKIT